MADSLLAASGRRCPTARGPRRSWQPVIGSLRVRHLRLRRDACRRSTARFVLETVRALSGVSTAAIVVWLAVWFVPVPALGRRGTSVCLGEPGVGADADGRAAVDLPAVHGLAAGAVAGFTARRWISSMRSGGFHEPPFAAAASRGGGPGRRCCRRPPRHRPTIRCGSRRGWSSWRRTILSRPPSITASSPARCCACRRAGGSSSISTTTPTRRNWCTGMGRRSRATSTARRRKARRLFRAHGKRRAFEPKPAGFRFYHTHVAAGGDLNRGTYTGQAGPVYIEPKDEPGTYDHEVFLVLKEFAPAFSRGGDMADGFPGRRPRSGAAAIGEAADDEAQAKTKGFEVGYDLFSINGRCSAMANRSGSRRRAGAVPCAECQRRPRSAAWLCPATCSGWWRSTAIRCRRRRRCRCCGSARRSGFRRSSR